MVLVDTSIWIHFFANRVPYAAELDWLLSQDQVAGHQLVYGELLIGDKGGRTKFLDAYTRMHQAESVPHADVVTFVRERRLYGRGTSWIDIHLLASAIVHKVPLWTADPRLAALARELGVAYLPA
ncbi:MAG: PIN domain-containing protein [Acidobacteria bacterium]|nr:PIN domain-containing protein [Acidobacteriota bacterium]